MSGIVYTTVDFRAHQKPTEVHANLRKHTTQAGAPDPTWSTEHDGMVEYSTLAIHQWILVKDFKGNIKAVYYGLYYSAWVEFEDIYEGGSSKKINLVASWKM